MDSLEETPPAVAAAPGYRRRIRVVPARAEVVAVLEDDIHSVAVRLHHDGSRVLDVEPVIDRLPWDTCPGAAAVLMQTFAGVPLSEVTARKDRKANCTHMHDMAVIAAAHALDLDETCFEIAVSDPVAGRRELELRRDGAPVQHWVEQDGVLVAPAEIAGRTLLTLRDWIAGLPAEQAETARMLQWAALVAHGRTMRLEEQSDAARMPANCYTFQPGVAARARRVGPILDFSDGERSPGETLDRRLGLARI